MKKIFKYDEITPVEKNSLLETMTNSIMNLSVAFKSVIFNKYKENHNLKLRGTVLNYFSISIVSVYIINTTWRIYTIK